MISYTQVFRKQLLEDWREVAQTHFWHEYAKKIQERRNYYAKQIETAPLDVIPPLQGQLRMIDEIKRMPDAILGTDEAPKE